MLDARVIAREARPTTTMMRHVIQLSRRYVAKGWNTAEDLIFSDQWKELCKNIGRRIWEDGYAPDAPSMHLIRDTCDYGTNEGIGIATDVKRSDTDRQHYWPMVSEMNRLYREVDRLSAIERHWVWRLWKWLTKKRRWW